MLLMNLWITAAFACWCDQTILRKEREVTKKLLCITVALVMMFFCGIVDVSAADDGTTTILAFSDFQHPDGNEAGAKQAAAVLEKMATLGFTTADGFICCGDYDYETVESAQGILAIKNVIDQYVSGDMVFTQGNHDKAGTDGLSPSGNCDPSNGAYGVFNINEDDYAVAGGYESTVEKTAENLAAYLNEKLAAGFDKPIFITSHLPLHYNMRTFNDGDAMYARYLFDVLNEAAEKGLNIIYLFGHNHSNGWDDYLGGSSVFLTKGDQILVCHTTQETFRKKTLNFTYMNAGYMGYYGKVTQGSDTALTMTTFVITDTEVTITRYDEDGIHTLKSEGVKNTNKGDMYRPNETVYSSPFTLALTKVTDKSPIGESDTTEPVASEPTEATGANTEPSATEIDQNTNGNEDQNLDGVLIIGAVFVGAVVVIALCIVVVRSRKKRNNSIKQKNS